MKKNILIRSLIGVSLGLTLSTMITIIISLIVGDGHFYPVVPELVLACGNEIDAILIQTICSFIYGAAWAGVTLIWTMESWSLLKQTVIHFLICTITTFPIAYFMYWIPHHIIGILTYFGIFMVIYIFIWLLQFTFIKKQIQDINQKIGL